MNDPILEDVGDGMDPQDDAVDQGPSPWNDAPRAHDYREIARPFDVTFRDLRGGVELEYITGEQATSRLNESLGMWAWDFEIIEHGIHAEADECWVLGKLTARILMPDPNLPGELLTQTVVKQQFGSQKVKRSRSSGTPLDIGFDLKGAATDALKKCASLIGVALYLWKKEPPAGLGTGGRPPGGPRPQGQPSGQPSQDRPAPPKRDDPPKPVARDVTQDDIDQYEVIRAEAVAAGFSAPWIEKQPLDEGWNSLQLGGYRSLLERHLDRVGRKAS